jgi:hypothetical protein
MKNIHFILLLGVVIISCSNEDLVKDESLLSFKTLIPSSRLESSNIEEMDTVLLFTGENVEWYNGTTGEIKFKNISEDDLVTCFAITVCLNDEPLLFPFRFVSDVMSYVINSPVLIYEVTTHRYYIASGYPDWDFLVDDNPNKKERDENWKRLKRAGRFLLTS